MGCERIGPVFTVCGAITCTHFLVWGSGETLVTQIPLLMQDLKCEIT